MRRFSLLSLLRESANAHEGWGRQWRAPEPKAGLRRGHRRRRRPRPRHRLLPRQGARHRATSPCWRRAGSAAATPAATPPSSAPTTSTTRAPRIYEHALKLWEGLSQELNYNVMFSPARRDDARAQRARRAELQAPRLRQPPQRHRQRVADAGGGQGLLPAAQHLAGACAIRSSARPCSGAAAWRATTRSPGAMPARADALGRRHHPELRGHGHPARSPTAPSRASRPRGASSARRASAWSRPATPASSWRGRACACRSRASRCRRWCRSRSSRSSPAS